MPASEIDVVRVEKRVDGRGDAFLVFAETRGERLDKLCLVHCWVLPGTVSACLRR